LQEEIVVSKENEEPSGIYAGIYYNDPVAAIDWLCRVFGFRKRLIVPGEHGTIVHSELSLGDGVVMVGHADAGRATSSPANLPAVNQSLYVAVPDPDAHYANAIAHGATITREIDDMEYGSREYSCLDLERHHWSFGTYVPGADRDSQVADLSPDPCSIEEPRDKSVSNSTQ
jgi:uncharacterized glyoxalase superfamily protein PhnB